MTKAIRSIWRKANELLTHMHAYPFGVLLGGVYGGIALYLAALFVNNPTTSDTLYEAAQAVSLVGIVCAPIMDLCLRDRDHK